MEKPNYYAVIPASVRYSKEITPQQKLMYGEISALTNKYGYCFASNEYFGRLYDKTNGTISRDISNLARAGFVAVDIDKKGGNERRITLLTNMSIALPKMSTPITKNEHPPITKNGKYNTTSINNTFNKGDARVKKADLTTEKKEGGSTGPPIEIYRRDCLLYFQEKTNRICIPGGKAGMYLGQLHELGYTVEQAKAVIDRKVKQFTAGDLRSEYLEPIVIFKPENFVGDLNALQNKGGKVPRDYSKIKSW